MAVDTTPGIRTVELTSSDKHRLVRLALEAEVKKKEAELARVKWEQASAESEAAGDAVAAKMLVPREAKDVTIDLNEGIIRFRMPGIPPSDEVVEGQ
jgi:hypothetical protein